MKKEETILRWKFIREGMKSENGKCKWKIDKWSKPIKYISMCNSGYHCSKDIYQAFSYVQGEILCQVECNGNSKVSDNKEVYETMKIVKAYKWQKKDSVALSIFTAKLCIENFEKVYPNDKRPREAIEAAEKWLKNPTKKNASAARSAAESAAESAAWSATRSATRSATWSARSAAWSAARSATRSATWSARSAAWSATRSAARSAAESAESAAESAAWSATRSATWSATWSAVIKKISKWFDKRLLVLEEIK